LGATQYGDGVPGSCGLGELRMSEYSGNMGRLLALALMAGLAGLRGGDRADARAAGQPDAPARPAGDAGQRPPSLLDRGTYLPDIATFMQIGGSGPLGYGWDGEGIFIGSRQSGTLQVYRLTPEGWPYQLSAFPDGISFFELSRGGELAVVGAAVGGSEQSQLYLMDTRTGRVVQLTRFEKVQIANVVWAPDDRAIYYHSNQENGRDFFIYRMDVATGEAAKIFGSADGVSGYNSILDVSQDGRRIIVSHLSSSADNDLYLVDLVSGESRKLTEDDELIRYGSPTLMPDNRTIWMTCNDTPDGLARIARMRLGSPDIEFVEDGWIDPRWEVESLWFSRDYASMYALVNEDGYARLRIRTADTLQPVPGPPLDGMIGQVFSDARGRVIFGFNSPTRASDVWRWDPAAGELEQLTFASYLGIDRTLFREPKLIHYPSFDGLEIPAFLYLPPDYEPGHPVPFIVDAHGGPEGQSRPYFQRNVQYLQLNSYGVLAPNVRGSTGYGRNYMNLDNYQKRKDSLKDYKAGIDWLVANGYCEPGKIGIRGGSYGGYVVLGMITEYPDLLSAAVDIVGIANFETFLENTAAYRRALREAEYGPLTDREFLRSISPIHKADQIKTPLLVVHGENDPRVPVGEARQIIRAIQAHGGEVDSLIFVDEGHGTGKRDNAVEEHEKQVAFFNRHLKR
jgi:dipeptidyl aminopeptidase/acylaminoacyl peptidase